MYPQVNADRVVSYVLSVNWLEEEKRIRDDLLVWATHARLLAESKARVAENKEKKKKEVKAATTTSMDVNEPGTIAQQVKRAVAKAVKKLKKVHDSVSTIASSSRITTELFNSIVEASRHYCSRRVIFESASRWPGEEEGEEEDIAPTTESRPVLEGKEVESKGKGQGKGEGESARHLVPNTGPTALLNLVTRRDIMSFLSCNNKFCCCTLGCDDSPYYEIGQHFEVLCEKCFKWN